MCFEVSQSETNTHTLISLTSVTVTTLSVSVDKVSAGLGVEVEGTLVVSSAKVKGTLGLMSRSLNPGKKDTGGLVVNQGGRGGPVLLVIVVLSVIKEVVKATDLRDQHSNTRTYLSLLNHLWCTVRVRDCGRGNAPPGTFPSRDTGQSRPRARKARCKTQESRT